MYEVALVSVTISQMKLCCSECQYSSSQTSILLNLEHMVSLATNIICFSELSLQLNAVSSNSSLMGKNTSIFITKLTLQILKDHLKTSVKLCQNIPSSAFFIKSSSKIFWCSSPSLKLYNAHFFNKVSPSPQISISNNPGNHSSMRESMWSTTWPRRIQPTWRKEELVTTSLNLIMTQRQVRGTMK